MFRSNALKILRSAQQVVARWVGVLTPASAAPAIPVIETAMRNVALDMTYRDSQGRPARVQPGEEVEITAGDSWCSLTKHRLIMAPSIARYFEVLQVRIGRDSLMDSALMGVAFSPYVPENWKPTLDSVPFHPTTLKYRINVRNVGTRPHLFKAYVLADRHVEP